MLLRAKKIAVMGLLAAFTVVMLILSSTIESSSLFFIAAASFCVGIVIREWGSVGGVSFLIGSTLLNALLAPNKIYCFTYAGMGVYLILAEWIWKKIADTPVMKNRMLKLWIGKYVIFNLIYLPIIWLMPSLIFTKEIKGVIVLFLWVAGQIGLFVYDYAYRYFQGTVWSKLRTRLLD